MPIRSFQENIAHLQRRFIYVIVAIIVIFVCITIRLYYLQILRGKECRSFAEENTLKEIRIPAVRGTIRDRYGDIIASNRYSFDVALIPQYIRDVEAVSQSLEELTGLPSERIMKLWPKTKRLPKYYPFIVFRDIGYDTMAQIQVHRAMEEDPLQGFDLRGVEILANPVRRYPGGSLAANTLGYVRESSPRELKRLQKSVPGMYYLGDRVGAFGLEHRWDVLLKGYDGYQQKFVNAVGKEVLSDRMGFKLARQKASPGLDLITTLDSSLQRYAASLFEGKLGALVALNPQNGEIYALVSQPSFDLSRLAAQVEEGEWQRLVEEPGKIFLNRATQSAYPPGSIYKIVMAAAALEEGVVKPEEKIRCPGYLRFGNRTFRCWKSGGHGAVNIHEAIVQSCDVFFYNMGIRLGVDRIAKYARLFGMGQKSGIEIEGETPGLIPTAEWKLKNRGSPWQPGENLSIAIGQGYDLVTPLQNALMISVVANGGYLVRPKLSRFFMDAEGSRFLPPNYLLTDRKEAVPVSSETLAILKKALIGVVAEHGGTAWRLRSLPFPVAGKTGTSQVVGKLSGKRGKQYRDHALFISFAPVEEPEIVVSVIVEHGGHGSSGAAPIAGKVLQKYMKLKEERAQKSEIGSPKSDARGSDAKQ